MPFAVTHDQSAPSSTKPLGGREANAGAAAGDDGNLVFQLRNVVSFFG
jgi:hypothetical protein